MLFQAVQLNNVKSGVNESVVQLSNLTIRKLDSEHQDIWSLTEKIDNPISRAKPASPPYKGGWGDSKESPNCRKIESKAINLGLHVDPALSSQKSLLAIAKENKKSRPIIPSLLLNISEETCLTDRKIKPRKNAK